LPIVVFLALSSAGPRKGIFGTFLAHPAFVALGRYAFAVYLWTVPLKHVLQESKVALVFMIVVFIWSGLYTHFIEEPVSNWLRARLKAWLDASR
jgi:peptidoglycan/LPS O-acetylase OafA/YrhL